VLDIQMSLRDGIMGSTYSHRSKYFLVSQILQLKPTFLQTRAWFNSANTKLHINLVTKSEP